MTQSVETLVEIASPALSESTPRLGAEYSSLAGTLSKELLAMLWARNGFYAFESALHVRALSDRAGDFGIAEWNSPSLWRSSYGGLADGLLFFAEDIFGGQFAIEGGMVHRFDPETGGRNALTGSLEDWATLLLNDSTEQTGWPLAHEWQTQFGPLAHGKRLIPKIPFVLGGEFAVDNLHAIDSVTAMRFYGDLASQLTALPDGAQIRLRVVE